MFVVFLDCLNCSYVLLDWLLTIKWLKSLFSFAKIIRDQNEIFIGLTNCVIIYSHTVRTSGPHGITCTGGPANRPSHPLNQCTAIIDVSLKRINKSLLYRTEQAAAAEIGRRRSLRRSWLFNVTNFDTNQKPYTTSYQ